MGAVDLSDKMASTEQMEMTGKLKTGDKKETVQRHSTATLDPQNGEKF